LPAQAQACADTNYAKFSKLAEACEKKGHLKIDQEQHTTNINHSGAAWDPTTTVRPITPGFTQRAARLHPAGVIGGTTGGRVQVLYQTEAEPQPEPRQERAQQEQ
jgi:hypothetical protein